jgi:ribosome biogenesis GTPase
VHNALVELGFDEHVEREFKRLSGITAQSRFGRVRRIDRGWSTYWCVSVDEMSSAKDVSESRVRNIGTDVAVGDWIVVSQDGEKIITVLPRRSQLIRRASPEDSPAEAQVVAANIDVIFLVHALDGAPNQRRLERELVLAFDSGAQPIVVLTKSDVSAITAVNEARRAIEQSSLGVPVLVVSSVTGDGLTEVRKCVRPGSTAVVLGASGAGKSTLINALTGTDSQQTGEVRRGDKRGRHTTTAAELIALPNQGWLIDTPGVRTVGLWTSGHGLERAFADIFGLADNCRFRDCKHENEPSCAVLAAIESGALNADRLAAMRRLVAEEAALEEQQRRAKKR